MIHFSCDACGKSLDPARDTRYVVKMELYAVTDPADDGPEDDRDHLLEIHEILERQMADESEEVSDESYQRRHYDLCPDCYYRFTKNPLAREQVAHLDFSEN